MEVPAGDLSPSLSTGAAARREFLEEIGGNEEGLYAVRDGEITGRALWKSLLGLASDLPAIMMATDR